MSVALVTDSTAYLAPEQIDRAPASVAVVPLHVSLGGVGYREGVDIGTGELAQAVRAFRPVSTSGPAPRELLECYRAAAEAGATAVVSVHLSGELSGTVQAARLAAEQAPVPVHVVDSRSIGMAMGYAVLSGAAASADGAGPEQVGAVARERALAASVVFYVDTLEYLRRGGRIGAAAALLGSALAIKPILSLQDGHIQPREKVRTGLRALARMVDIAEEAADRTRQAGRGFDVAVQHLDMAERADSVAATLRDRLRDAGEVVVGEMGAVAGAHVGPGTLVVVVSPRPQTVASW